MDAKTNTSTAGSAKAVDARIRETACQLAAICDDRRGQEILVLDLRGICGYADYFVIATVTSKPQMKGIAREAEKAMKERGVSLLSRNGLESGNWALLDYGDVVLHVFNEEARDFYQLETLWGDAKRVTC